MLKKFSNNFTGNFASSISGSSSSPLKSNPLRRVYCWLACRVWLVFALAWLLLFGYVVAHSGWYLMLVLFIQTLALIIAK